MDSSILKKAGKYLSERKNADVTRKWYPYW